MRALPALLALLGGGTAYVLYKQHENPSWSPISAILATPSELRAALARVTHTSVPTPDPTSALDPNMTTAHVDAANKVLVHEVSLAALKDFAAAADKMGFTNTAHAVKAKADAVSDATAKGASPADIAAAAQAPAPTVATGFDLFAHGNAAYPSQYGAAPTPRRHHRPWQGQSYGGSGSSNLPPCTPHDISLGRQAQGLCR